MPANQKRMMDNGPASHLIPRHHQLYIYLRELILDGTYPTGEAMPAEHRLATKFGMSRVTVRRTLDTLETEGIIERRHGVGTFPIRSPALQGRSSSAESYMQYVSAAARDYEHELIEFAHVPTPHFLDSSEAGFGPVVLKIVRVASVKGKPVHTLTGYTSGRLSDLIVKRELSNRPVVEILREGGCAVRTSLLSISACSAGAFEAAHLDVPISTALTRSDRVSSVGGKTVDHNTVRSRTDRFHYGFVVDDDSGLMRPSQHD